MALPLPENTKFVAALPHVREVSLIGRADLAYWANRLQAEELVPANYGGHARIMLSAMRSVFKGVSFRELVVSVPVSRHFGESEPEGVFLIQAFNSIRLFAWVERTCFSTPYRHGDIELQTETPVGLNLTLQGREVFHASMSPLPGQEADLPQRVGAEGFAGPVFLPARHRGPGAARKFFYARIHGATQVFAFDARKHALRMEPNVDPPMFRELSESRLEILEWHIRPDALHAKGKTLSRDRLPNRLSPPE